MLACVFGLSFGVSTAAAQGAGPIDVWGHERLAWDQPAISADSLRDLTFFSIIEGFREPLEDVRCSTELNRFGLAGKYFAIFLTTS